MKKSTYKTNKGTVRSTFRSRAPTDPALQAHEATIMATRLYCWGYISVEECDVIVDAARDIIFNSGDKEND